MRIAIVPQKSGTALGETDRFLIAILLSLYEILLIPEICTGGLSVEI